MNEFPMLPDDLRFTRRLDRLRSPGPGRPPIPPQTAFVGELATSGSPGPPTQAIPDLIVANTRSKRYYLPSDKSYRRAKKQKNIEFYSTEEEAAAAGYSKHK